MIAPRKPTIYLVKVTSPIAVLAFSAEDAIDRLAAENPQLEDADMEVVGEEEVK